MATVVEYYTPTSGSDYASLAKTWKSQSFLATESHTISSIKLKLKRSSTAVDTEFSVKLCANDGGLPGTVLATFGTFTVQDLTTSWVEYEFSDTTYAITSGTAYVLSITTEDEITTSTVYWYTSINSGYTDGRRGSGNYILGWGLESAENDAWFEVYKTEAAPPGKARYPTPADGAEKVAIRGIDALKYLQWEAPA